MAYFGTHCIQYHTVQNKSNKFQTGLVFICYCNILSQNHIQVKLQDCFKSGITTQVQKPHAKFTHTAFTNCL